MQKQVIKKSAHHRPSFLRFLIGLVLIVGILLIAKPIIVPLALAVLLTFILTPVVSLFERRLGRITAVLVVVLTTLIIAGLCAWGVGAEVTRLARDLPKHSEQIQAKFDRVRGSGSALIDHALKLFHHTESQRVAAEQAADARQAPVVVQREPTSIIEPLWNIAGAILEPIATGGLVVILVVFMLIKREDLRNRVIGLLGRGRMTGATRVTVEAARRLSSFLLAQLCVNASFGLLFGLGLLFLGVPYAFLWGFLMGTLRFVPYIGTWIAASGPIMLSVAISTGWKQPIGIFVLFLSMDLLTANAVEPILFGHRTGVSPVALLVAAAFWTWVWGPVGLVLSTPLTVCLVVLGQHAPRLRFLTMLLGDEPALEPHMNYYQRLLAGDEVEATTIVRHYIREHELAEVYDGILLPALIQTRRDRQRSGLTNQDESAIFQTTRKMVLAVEAEADEKIAEEMKILHRRHNAEESDEDANQSGVLDPSEETDTNQTLVESFDARPLVLACPAHHEAEELSLEMTGRLLEREGCRVRIVSTRTLPSEIEQMVSDLSPEVVLIAVAPPGGITQARYLSRRLRKRFSGVKIVVGYWGRVKNFDALLVQLRAAGANYVATSIAQTVSQVRAVLGESLLNARATAGAVEKDMEGNVPAS